MKCQVCLDIGIKPNRMDAPDGPVCACGKPSVRESGSCGEDHGPVTCECQSNPLEALANSDFAKALQAACDEAEDAPAEKSGDGWKGSIGGFAPVQGDGQVDGKFWYFRARHDSWSFEVYTKSCRTELPDESPLWETSGKYGNASWMKLSEAWGLIEASLAKYRRDRTTPPTPWPGASPNKRNGPP